ncbi:hypothetical protein Gohar_002856, partial [Gossypium harknessii]|nr:hypothetical protein [Gossypium harknessii]
MFAWVNNFLEGTCFFEVLGVISMSIQKPSQMKFWIIHMFRDVLFFIMGAIGMVQEPQHLVNDSTYFCGVEGNIRKISQSGVESANVRKKNVSVSRYLLPN